MKHLFKNLFKAFGALSLAAAGVCLTAGAVYADTVDLARTGSVTVKFISPKTGEPVTDGEFTLYHVADLSRQEDYLVYTYSGEFYYCSADLGSGLNQSLAESLAEYVEETGAEGITKSLGSDGTVKFDGLSLGLYLIIQTKASEGYYAAVPFLAAIPITNGSEWIYDVEAEPKISRYGEEETEITTESSGEEEESETGTEETEKTETTTESSSGGGGGTPGSGNDDDDEDDDDGEPGGSSGGGSPSGGGGGGSYIIGGSDSSSPEYFIPNSSYISNDSGTHDDMAHDDDEAHTPEDPADPPEEEEDPPDQPDGGTTVVKKKLPQTGQANLPVPILALSGLGLFSAGWKLYFTDGRKKDAA